MEEKEKYLAEVDSNLKKFKGDISKLDNMVKKYSAPNRKKILAEGEIIKDKYKEAEEIYEKLKSSSQESFGDIKTASSEIFSSLSESLNGFTNLVSMKNLNRLTEEITDYSSEKISEVDDYIKKNPFSFIIGAFGVGIVIGLLINRLK